VADSLEGVHRAALVLACHLGTDVDVEFALPAAGGEPVILQCRPITGGIGPPLVGDAGTVTGRMLLQGRAGAAGSATGVATDPFHSTGQVEEPRRIAVVGVVTTADYEIVFRHAAVVTERDASPLSHVAILCRELGVPLVCGVNRARDLLIGRLVAVDGAAGEVRILDDETAARGPGTGVPPPPRSEATVAISAVELVLRVIAEGGPGRRPADEAGRIARRYARALGTDSVDIVGHPVGPGDLAQVEQLGATLFGPDFSAAAFLTEFSGGRLPTA
jgi:phosphohistidine swiveling domain-containing protein